MKKIPIQPGAHLRDSFIVAKADIREANRTPRLAEHLAAAA
jgi:hypothetical protein